MTREMLRAKVHRITVTECDVTYEGSLTLDRDLMDACGMVEFERVDVYDVDNASRFSTYLIEGARGSGQCCINGAAVASSATAATCPSTVSRTISRSCMGAYIIWQHSRTILN